MNNNRKIYPLSDNTDGLSDAIEIDQRDLSSQPVIDTTSLIGSSDSSSYLKLKQFRRLDPTLKRLLFFLACFGVTANFVSEERLDDGTKQQEQQKQQQDQFQAQQKDKVQEPILKISKIYMYIKILIMFTVCALSLEVVLDLNFTQSKLITEQKRAAPLLTFVIFGYSVTTLIIPIISDAFLIMIGSHLFRFYSRTTETVCNGHFFGRKTSVDTLFYYYSLIMVAFLDAVGQFIVSGVWPQRLDPYIRMIIGQKTISSNTEDFILNGTDLNSNRTPENLMPYFQPAENISSSMLITSAIESHSVGLPVDNGRPKIHAYMLDMILGKRYAHSDLVSLANHYATILKDINKNLEKYSSRTLLKQLIILRDSCEQISIMTSLPFALTIQLVFTRQIALIGVFIQSTMMPYENWAILLQSLTCATTLFTVFLFCDGLQSASRHTHRLKTEQTVIDDSQGGDQSIYEFLDYLNRLSKSIRMTFFNIIAINKNSLVSLYGHILTLTLVTS